MIRNRSEYRFALVKVEILEANDKILPSLTKENPWSLVNQFPAL